MMRMLNLLLPVLVTAACVVLPARARAADDGTLGVVATIPVGDAPSPMALDSDGRRLYVANRRSGSISIIDLDAGRVASEWSLGSGVWGLAHDEVAGRLYAVVGDRPGPQTLLALDRATGAQVGAISTGLGIGGVALDPRARRLFATGGRLNTGGIGIPHLLVVDTEGFALVENRFVGVNGSSAMFFPSIDTCRHHLYVLYSVRTFGTDLQVYDTMTLEKIEGGPLILIGFPYLINGLSVDVQRQRPIVTVGVPPAPREYVSSIGGGRGVDLPGGGPVAVDQRSGIVYVASRVDRSIARPSDPPPMGRLTAIDLDREAILGSVELGRGPHNLVVDPADSRVYVTNEADDTVTIVQGIRPPPDTPMPACG